MRGYLRIFPGPKTSRANLFLPSLYHCHHSHCHLLQFWQLKTWIHDNLCYLPIKSDTWQNSQFLWCFNVITTTLWISFERVAVIEMIKIFNPTNGKSKCFEFHLKGWGSLKMIKISGTINGKAKCFQHTKLWCSRIQKWAGKDPSLRFAQSKPKSHVCQPFHPQGQFAQSKHFSPFAILK